MKILVTGGAGFIGSHLCDRLLAQGHSVVAVDNLILGKRANLSHLHKSTSLRFVEMDVTNIDRLQSLFEENQFQCVFHLAANSDIERSFRDPGIDFTNTLCTTYAVLEAMRRCSVTQLVFASTSAVYGEALGCIREDHGPLLPISHYGAAKLASEALISSYGENYSIQSWIARFPNVVGGRATHGAVFDFAAKLKRTPSYLEVLGDGAQIKPYLHVSDLLTALIMAWERFSERTNLFNVGGPTRCTVKRMAEIVVEESGLNARIEYLGGDRGWIGDVPSVDFDTSRIRQLGWAPALNSEEAIRAAARWLFENIQ